MPEGFFDDPTLDAKARKVDKRREEDEEYKKFMEEIAPAVQAADDLADEEDMERMAKREEEEEIEQRYARGRGGERRMESDLGGGWHMQLTIKQSWGRWSRGCGGRGGRWGAICGWMVGE